MSQFTHLTILLATILILDSCSDNKVNTSESCNKIIHYFDSNQIKEFYSLHYTRSGDFGKHLWSDDYSPYLGYSYRVGFPSRFPEDYKFPTVDSIDRILISNLENFNAAFPLKVRLPNKPVEMSLNKTGLVDCRISWMNLDYEEKHDILFKSLDPSLVFTNRNPFYFFKLKSKIMDSLGVYEVHKSVFGNFITIVVKPDQEFLEYLPSNLLVDSFFRHRFDSIISSGKRIDKNWVFHVRSRT